MSTPKLDNALSLNGVEQKLVLTEDELPKLEILKARFAKKYSKEPNANDIVRLKALLIKKRKSK